MSLHKAEEVLKKGSLKTFIRVIEENKVDIFDRDAFLFRQAIQYGQFPILRYLFLGEYHTLYDPKRPETLQPVLTAVRLVGKPVFDLPILDNSYLAESDHVGIFNFLKAFGYDVTKPSMLQAYKAQCSFNILTHILTTGEVPAETLIKGDRESQSFEVLALLNTKAPVKIRAVSYIPSWTDERLNLFRVRGSDSRYNMDNLEMAIRDHNIDFVREYLSRLEVPKGAHDRLINYCDHNHSGLAILKLLFSHGVVPTDLTDFVRYQSSFNNEPGAQFTKAALSISLENSKLLLGSNDGIRETLLRRADEYLYFLVSNNLIEKSVSNATIVLQASAGKKRAMERMITLYQFGFPVLELDLGEIFADSVSRLDGAMIIQKYLRSLLIPEADEQVVAGKDGQIQLL